MNFEELQDPKLRRQASGYCAWLDAIDRQKKLIADYGETSRNSVRAY